MSRNTEFQFVSTDAAEITNFLITVYENLTGVHRKSEYSEPRRRQEP